MGLIGKKKLFIIFFCLLGWFFFLWIRSGIHTPINSSGVFEIKKGDSFLRIGDNLRGQGFIKSGLFFDIYVLLKSDYNEIKAGEYEISKGMSIPEISRRFVLGEVIEKKITIFAGWNIDDIGDALDKEGIVSKDKLSLVLSSSFSDEFSFLKDKPNDMDLEGYLFPDTYNMNSYMKPEDIVREILSNFDKKLSSKLRADIQVQKKSIFDIITMASIIEKEARGMEDKKTVSGILWKRLKIGMPLQVDATVNYATGKNNRNVPIKDTKIDSPYNTYKYTGLPKGPISNPSLESILAAIYPKQTSYLYYLSPGDGITIFNSTLEGHNASKAEYLR